MSYTETSNYFFFSAFFFIQVYQYAVHLKYMKKPLKLLSLYKRRTKIDKLKHRDKRCYTIYPALSNCPSPPPSHRYKDIRMEVGRISILSLLAVHYVSLHFILIVQTRTYACCASLYTFSSNQTVFLSP